MRNVREKQEMSSQFLVKWISLSNKIGKGLITGPWIMRMN